MPTKPPLIYAIPGLGTDWRIFGPLAQHMPLRFLNWLEPTEQESLAAYATRMAEPIRGENTYLLGVSFGGVVAQEIARQISLKGLILVSSLKHHQEKPPWLRLMRNLPLYRLSKGDWRVKTLPLWSPGFGITKQAEQELLKDMFSSFGDAYRMWAINQLIHWEAQPSSLPLLHIHGTRDRVLPGRYVKGFTPVAKGTHFMVYQQAEIVHQHIQTWLGTLPS